MGFKNKRELFLRIGIVSIVLACLPTLYWAVSNVLQGDFGNLVHNLKGQPNHPIIVLIVFTFLVLTLFVSYFKNKD